MSDKLKVGILGATGMVGQRFISLLRTILGSRLLQLQPAQEAQARHTKRQLVTDGRWIHRCQRQLRSL